MAKNSKNLTIFILGFFLLPVVMIESNKMMELNENFYNDTLEYGDNLLKTSAEIGALTYSSFFGGTGGEMGTAIALDTTGCIYIVGDTGSSDFPITSGVYDGTYNGGSDIFVSKFSADGSTLEYSTFIGGTGSEYTGEIVVDNSGNVYILGMTNSIDFPTSSGAIDSTHNGGLDIFVCKLNPDGTDLLYSTYLGGLGSEYGYGLAVDGTGNAYITGRTQNSTINYPTTAAFNESNSGGFDIFVSKINSDGTNLEYSTFIGGLGNDLAYAIDIDNAGCAYITGGTAETSTLFPTTSGAYDETYNGGTTDIFLCKINTEGTALDYSTFIGGSGSETARDITIDGNGDIFITGTTSSANFITTAGALNSTLYGTNDIFICKFSADGTTLEYSTLIGGSDDSDQAFEIVIDNAGCAYIIGEVQSPDYPTTVGALAESNPGGSSSGFLSKINHDGTVLEYSTYLGGSGTDWCQDIEINADGAVYLTGYTDSSNFPSTMNAYDDSYNDGPGEAFLSIFNIVPDLSPIASFSANKATIDVNQSISFTFTGNMGNSPAILEWNFNDGTGIVVDINPSHKFTLVGNYIVSLTITDLDGDTDTSTMSITVQEPETGGSEEDTGPFKIPGYSLELMVICSVMIMGFKIKKRRN